MVPPATGEILIPSMISILDFFFPNLDELWHFKLSVSTNNLPTAGGSSHLEGTSNLSVTSFEKPVSDVAPFLR